MAGKNYFDELYNKMCDEQAKFREWLLEQEPKEILRHCYEYSIREDILLCMEGIDLTDVQAYALLRSPVPLDDIFKEYSRMDNDHMNDIRDTIENRADFVLSLNSTMRNQHENFKVSEEDGKRIVTVAGRVDNEKTQELLDVAQMMRPDEIRFKKTPDAVADDKTLRVSSLPRSVLDEIERTHTIKIRNGREER